MNDASPRALPQPAAAMAPRRVGASLGFVVAGGRTILGPQHTPHPFHVTRPFHLAGDPPGMATLYLQSSSGGLYGDDDLALDLDAGAESRVHLTTQAASVVHPARGGRTRQAVRIVAERSALVEYLPDPVILFGEANLSASVSARLAEGAILMLGDAALTHDPDGAGAPFAEFRNTILVEDASGAPLLIERMKVTGADWLARSCGLPAHGLFLVAGAIDCAAMQGALAAALAPDAASPKVYAACAGFPETGVVIARFLCADGATLTRVRDLCWSAARQAATGRAPPPRRK